MSDYIKEYVQTELIRKDENGHTIHLISYILKDYAQLNKVVKVFPYEKEFVVSKVFDNNTIRDYTCYLCKFPERLCDCKTILEDW